MAGNTAILSVRITGDAKQGVSALNSTERAAGKLKTGMGKVGSVLKGVGFGVATAGAVGLGYALKQGFTRLTGIENAQAKMKGLGHDTKAVDTIMDGALKSVKGTAFSLDEAATTAAGAVAAGIKPGKELDGVLSTVSNSAAAAGVGMDEMGGIFNKVATTGKAQNDALRQVADRGIPIYQELSDQLGVTTDEVFKMASAGKISFSDFETAMSSASGAVADEMGNTATGTITNFNAAVGRLGEGLLGGFFPHIAPIVGALTNKVDEATEAVGPLAESLGNKLGGAVENIVTWIDKLEFSSFDAFLTSSGLSSAPEQFASIGQSLKDLAPAFGEFLKVVPKLGPALGTLAGAGLNLVTDALSFLADHVDTIVALMPLIVGGFVAWRVASAGIAQSQLAVRAAEAAAAPLYLSNQILRFANVRAEQQLAIAKGQATTATVVNNGAENAGLLTRIRGTAALVAQRVALFATSAATRAAAAGQWLLNAAMTANPIGLIVAGLVLLVAGIIWAWNNIDGFRDGILAAWDWIKTGTVTIWNSVVDFIGTAIEGIGNFFTVTLPGAVQTVLTWLGANWPLVVSIITGPIGALVVFVITHWNQIKTATVAAFTAVKNFLVNIWNTVVSWVVSKVVGFVTSVVNTWNNLKAKSQAVFNLIKATIKNAIVTMVVAVVSKVAEFKARVLNTWTMIKARTLSIFAAIVITVKNKIEAVVSTVKGMPGKAKAAMGNLGGLLKGAGKSLIQGFINGINNMIGKVTSAAKNVVSKVRDFFPFSPAKTGPFSGRGYTTYSGKALVGDFAKAMTTEISSVRSAANSVAKAGTFTAGYELDQLNASGRTGRRGNGSVIKVEINIPGLVTDPVGVGREIRRVMEHLEVVEGRPA